MPSKNFFTQSINRALSKKQNWTNARPAILGDGRGNLRTSVANKVYALVGGALDVVTCTRIPADYGLRVWVGYAPEEPTLYQVLSARSSDPTGTGAEFGGYAPAERYRLGSPVGGQDPLWLEKRAWLELRVGMTNPASMKVQVMNGNIWDGSRFVYVPLQTVDLSDYVPTTSGKAALVAIVVLTDGSIVSLKGSEVNLADLIPSGNEFLNAPNPFDGVDVLEDEVYDVLAFVRVYYGQTAVREGRTLPNGSNTAFTDFIDVRGRYYRSLSAASSIEPLQRIAIL